MSETIDELGPVDYIVVEFPGNKFTGEIAPALGDLVDRELVKVLDLVFVTKAADGHIEGFELEDLDEGIAGEIEQLEMDIVHVLSEDDVVALAGAMEPDSSAALLVWENRWAAPFASAVRHSGGQLVASGRIPIQALIGARRGRRRRSLRCLGARRGAAATCSALCRPPGEVIDLHRRASCPEERHRSADTSRRTR